jgi:hypothetical protein
MSRKATWQQHKVPFLAEKAIEDHAELLLAEWAEKHGPVATPPVPIEDILELHLELAFAIDDLQTALGHADVLGGIWFGERLIKIDRSLDPSVEPRMLGRYRFTLAHEVGHWRLHRQHLMNDPSARSLFQQACEPAFVCRSSNSPREEVQANLFASYVLMPRRLVHAAWFEWRTTCDPVALSDLVAADKHPDEDMVLEQFCRPLAERFQVSAQAMRIRLENMKLLVRKKEPSLFE